MYSEKIRKELKNGSSIGDVCKKYDISFKQLVDLLMIKGKSKRLPDHIYMMGKRYGIRKTVNNKTTYYGSFNSLDEAIDVRNELILHNWDMIPTKYLGDMYIIHDKGNFRIRKYLDGSTKEFGTYSNRSDARKVRDELVMCNWQKSELDNICEKLGVERIRG